MKSIKYSLIILLLIIGLVQNVDAQWGNSNFHDFYYPSWNNPNFYNRKVQGVKEKSIQSQVIIKEEYKKEKPFREICDQIKKFDKNGNEVEFTNNKRNGKINNRTVSTYDTANNQIRQISFNRKKQLSDDRAIYDNLKNCTEFTHYNSKGKIKKKMEYVWDSSQQSEVRSYKNGIDLTFKWVFEYNPDKTANKTTKYNAKGKIKKVWTYDCNLLGDVMKKHEDTVKMCRFDSTDKQGYFYKIYKTSKENGKLYKTINKFSKDSIYLGYKYIDEKNRILSFSEVSYSGDTIISIYKSYNNRGKSKHNTIYKQDKKRNTLYSENCWKGRNCAKKKYISEYLYNNKGILLKITTYHGSDIYAVWNYYYTFY